MPHDRRLSDHVRRVLRRAIVLACLAGAAGCGSGFAAADKAGELRLLRDQLAHADETNEIVLYAFSRAVDESLQEISESPHVERLYLESIYLGDERFSPLLNSKSLKAIGVFYGEVTLKDVEVLTSINSLQAIALFRCRVTDDKGMPAHPQTGTQVKTVVAIDNAEKGAGESSTKKLWEFFSPLDSEWDFVVDDASAAATGILTMDKPDNATIRTVAADVESGEFDVGEAAQLLESFVVD